MLVKTTNLNLPSEGTKDFDMKNDGFLPLSAPRVKDIVLLDY